ncbi:MAG TPA: SRPBCC domain-containing protein [Thermoleophilaceae bacterium]|jgi:uncharacterized protein YndB with AHSA1/START domain
MPKEFEIRREVELPAAPEDVWEAIATGAGHAAWLFPNEIGSGEGTQNPDGSVITAWDPPHRFEVRVESDEGTLNALEFIIEGREGGTTVLRYVHSGMMDDEDWDTQYDAADDHTDFYLHTLGQYLEHFNGRRATYIGGGPGGLQAPDSSNAPGAFDRVKEALGVTGDVGEGDRVRVDLPGGEGLDATVDYLRPNFVGIRTADGLYRFFGRNAFGMPVGMSAHLYSDGVDRDEQARAWQSWLEQLYS